MTKRTQTSGNQSDIRKDCVLYYRVSRDAQEQDRQKSQCLQYCQENGYNIVCEPFEEKKSGRRENRAVMTKCLKYIKDNNIHYLILAEISRLSRSLEGSSVIRQLTADKVCVIGIIDEIKTLDDNFNEDREMTARASQAVTDAIKESNRIGSRVMRGKKAKLLSRNRWQGGKFLPYGYTSDNGNFVIEPREAETVKLIFNKYLDGWGSIKIANFLNMQGIRTKLGSIWQRSTINQMLIHDIYTGKRTYQQQSIHFPELRIIEDELFYAVQKRMKERKNTDQTFNQLRKYDFLYDRGLIKCGVCGKNYVASIRKEAPEKGIYKCSTGKYSKGCGCESVRVNIVEQVINRFLFKNSFKLLRDNTALHQKSESINLELSLLQAEQSKITEELNRLNEIYLKGRISEQDYENRYNDLNKVVTGLQEKINGYKASLQEIRQADRVIVNEKLNYVGGKLNLVSTNINKETLHRVIKQITVNKRENKQQLINVELFNGNRFYFDYMLYTKGNFEDVDKLPTIITGFELK